MLFLKMGACKVTVFERHPSGMASEHEVGKVCTGDTVGEIALLSDHDKPQLRSANVVSITYCDFQASPLSPPPARPRPLRPSPP